MKKLLSLLDFISFRWISIFLICKLSLLIFLQIKISSDFPTTIAIDNDGAAALDTLFKTNLINDNKWYAYGPVYYRIASIITFFTHPSSLKDNNLNEAFHYFTLIFVSFLCFIACFFVSAALDFKKLNFKKLTWCLSSVLIFLFLADENTFLRYLLYPHPDYTQSLFQILCYFFLYLCIVSDKKIFTLLAYVSLGVAFATKASTLYLGISFFLVANFLNRHYARSNFKFLLLLNFSTILSYFLVGFPQNFKIHRTINFLLFQSRYHLAPNYDSISEWFILVSKGILLFLPLIFLVPIRHKVGRKGLTTIASLWVVSFLTFSLTARTAQESDYYIIPYVLTSLPLLCIISVQLREKFNTSLRWEERLLKIASFAVFFIPLSTHLSFYVVERENCRSHIKEASLYYEAQKLDFEHFVIDAYFPYKREIQDSTHTWGLSKETFKKGKSLLGLSFNFVQSNFSNINAYTRTTNPEIEKNIAFYDQLKSNKIFEIDNLKAEPLKYFGCNLQVWSITTK